MTLLRNTSMNLTQQIQYLKETGIETEAMGEIIIHLEALNSTKPVGLFSTPESMEELQDYLAIFSKSEGVGVVANTCAFMMYNLMVKHIKNEGEH